MKNAMILRYKCVQPNTVYGYKVYIYAWYIKNDTGSMTQKAPNLLRMIIMADIIGLTTPLIKTDSLILIYCSEKLDSADPHTRKQ